jgi:CzcA family heavy metal efflux pump
MINRLILWSITHHLTVVIASVVLLLVGLNIVAKLPLDVFPNFAPPQVVIQTEAPGLAPEEVESLVTLPLESSLNGTPGVVDIRSSSAIGLSVVTVIFEGQTDVYRARQLVAEKVQQVAPRLPQGVNPPLLSPISNPVGDVVKYALTIDNSVPVAQRTTLLDVATISNWQIRNRLLAIPGVTRVLVLGGGERQYQILVQPQKLKQFNVTLAQVTEAARAANLNVPGGFLLTPDRERLVRGMGRTHSSVDLGNSVVVARPGGIPVRLSDVADIKIGSGVKRGDGSFAGQDAVIVTVTRSPFADTPAVTRSVESAMDDIRKTLPKDVKVVTTFRQEDFIQKSVDNVVEALRDGAIIVSIIVILFLGNWRTVAITLTALPLSIVLGLVVLNWFGVGLNTMTLGGLAIALGGIIDDAIIDAENVYRRLRENNALGAAAVSPAKVVFDASVQIRSSVVLATIIVCIVVAPIFTLSGVEGRIFTPLGMAYILSTLASLLVALTLTPALCYLLLANRRLPEDETWLVRKLKGLYKPILSFSMAKPSVILLVSGAALIVSLALIPTLGTTFLPEFQERSLVIALNQLPGASLASTQEIGKAIEIALLKHPEIETAQFRAGRAFGDDDAGVVTFGELDLQIAEKGVDRAKVLDIIRDELARYPGVVAVVGGFISNRIDETLSGTRAALAIKVFGPDLDILRAKAQEIDEAIRKVPGIVDLQVEPQVPVPQISVQFNREKASRYGLTVGSLAETVETALNGRVVSQVLEDQRLFSLVVWLSPEARNNVETIGELLIDTPVGTKIPLSAVAALTEDAGPNTINRQRVSRRIVISANTADRDIGSVVADVRKEISEHVKLPTGYYVAYGGQFEAQQRASQELLIFGAVALLAVAFLVHQAVNTIRSTVLVLANLPLALIGGLLAVVLGGGVLSVASLIGFITLFGVACRNGIILVTTYNQMTDSGIDFEHAIKEGSIERLSPVLMTALTAALAMLPLMIGSGAGKEILQPLAVVVFGGLFSSTALTLVVIPALFTLFGERSVSHRALGPINATEPAGVDG